MAGLAGLSPLVGLDVVQPEASAEERLGGTAHREHARPLWAQPERMPWQLQAYGTPAKVSPPVDAAIIDADGGSYAAPAGLGYVGVPLYDATPPHSHAAPWPKGVETSVGPDATARRLEQSAAIHATGLGASSQKILIPDATQDLWLEVWNTGPETATLQQPVNGQVRIAAGGFGSTDRSSNPRGLNGHDYQNAHLHRRYAVGSVPGNYMYLKPGGRPMIKTLPGPARPPIGAHSPFTGQDLRLAFGVQGAILANPAPDYTAPPDPYTGPPISAATPVTSPADVDYW